LLELGTESIVGCLGEMLDDSHGGMLAAGSENPDMALWMGRAKVFSMSSRCFSVVIIP
jgi:hypothetical protein